MNTIQSNRISWIDNAKFLAIMCVIVGHSFSMIKGEFYGYDEFNLFIVAFNMPLFALLSGVTSFKSLSRIQTFGDLINYFNKILWHVGVPTVVYTLIAISISYAMQARFERSSISFGLLILLIYCIYYLRFSKNSGKHKSLDYIFPYLILPICLINQSVWYFVYVILAILSAGLSTWIANRFSNHRMLVFLFTFLFLSIVISPASPFYSTLELYLPFVIGFVYSSRRGLQPEKFASNKTFFATLLGLGLIGVILFLQYESVENQFYVLDFFQAYREETIGVFIYRQISAVMLSIFLVLLIQHFSKNYNIISTLGAMSFGLYPIHAEIIGIIKYYCPRVAFSPLIDILFVFILALLILSISALIINQIRKSAYFKLILLGE